MNTLYVDFITVSYIFFDSVNNQAVNVHINLFQYIHVPTTIVNSNIERRILLSTRGY